MCFSPYLGNGCGVCVGGGGGGSSKGLVHNLLLVDLEYLLNGPWAIVPTQGPLVACLGSRPIHSAWGLLPPTRGPGGALRHDV